jgi:Protein of unknown function (DUF3455).
MNMRRTSLAICMSLFVCVVALTAVVAAARPRPAHDGPVTPPRVPASVEVPGNLKAFLEGHATGTQNYVCLPSGASVAWTFVAPQATLFDDDRQQIITHFLSGNPSESGTPRATWQHSADTSAVWAVTDGQSSDPTFVKPGAIPWFRLRVVGAQAGPTGRHTLTPTVYIQRLNTVGGSAPPTGCAQATDVGKKVVVPYKADYLFYERRGRDAAARR